MRASPTTVAAAAATTGTERQLVVLAKYTCVQPEGASVTERLRTVLQEGGRECEELLAVLDEFVEHRARFDDATRWEEWQQWEQNADGLLAQRHIELDVQVLLLYRMHRAVLIEDALGAQRCFTWAHAQGLCTVFGPPLAQCGDLEDAPGAEETPQRRQLDSWWFGQLLQPAIERWLPAPEWQRDMEKSVRALEQTVAHMEEARRSCGCISSVDGCPVDALRAQGHFGLIDKVLARLREVYCVSAVSAAACVALVRYLRHGMMYTMRDAHVSARRWAQEVAADMHACEDCERVRERWANAAHLAVLTAAVYVNVALGADGAPQDARDWLADSAYEALVTLVRTASGPEAEQGVGNGAAPGTTDHRERPLQASATGTTHFLVALCHALSGCPILFAASTDGGLDTDRAAYLKALLQPFGYVTAVQPPASAPAVPESVTPEHRELDEALSFPAFEGLRELLPADRFDDELILQSLRLTDDDQERALESLLEGRVRQSTRLPLSPAGMRALPTRLRRAVHRQRERRPTAPDSGEPAANIGWYASRGLDLEMDEEEEEAAGGGKTEAGWSRSGKGPASLSRASARPPRERSALPSGDEEAAPSGASDDGDGNAYDESQDALRDEGLWAERRAPNRSTSASEPEGEEGAPSPNIAPQRLPSNTRHPNDNPAHPPHPHAKTRARAHRRRRDQRRQASLRKEQRANWT
ncbi:hypothetical protein CDCA_CDCA03G1025 [Cyanidium caldarium]|uniref:CUE domain-containing protein n=1 Tax=Cyanidium caldarium TaxID=2771 RepID=A0AAV9ISD5_CYACA|nr:hypothetical protein CDCA_CDCA03G1025 [Cyanidium caldarium]